MKFKTSELTGYNLNQAVAAAIQMDAESAATTFYNPEQDWAQCGELIDKFNISLKSHSDDRRYFATSDESEITSAGDTPQQAICRCVVASVYGDEVEL